MKLLEKALFAIVFFLCWLFLGGWLFASGKYNSYTFIWGGHDPLWHLSLVWQIKEHGLPVFFPGANNVLVSNYNYLSDLFLAFLSKIFSIPVDIFYLKVANILTIGGFVSLVFLFSKKISKSKLTALYSTVLVSFAGTASFLVPLINKNQLNPQSDVFMLNQIANQAINLHTILGYLFLIGFLWLYFDFLKEETIKKGILAGVLLGLLFGIKAFLFIPLFISLGTFSGYFFLKERKIKALIPLIISVIFAFCLSRIFVSQSSFPFEIKPFWILEKMVEDSNRFYWPKRVLLDQQ